jgi:transporter family-2 protein
MGLGGKPLSLARVAGVVLILCGVLLVQGTWTTAPATPMTTVKQPEG